MPYLRHPSSTLLLLTALSGCFTDFTGTGEGSSLYDASTEPEVVDADPTSRWDWDASQSDGAARPAPDGQVAPGQPDASRPDAGEADGGIAPDAQAPNPDAGGDEDGGPSSGPGDWTAGDYPSEDGAYLTIVQSGLKREYRVHVPPSYDPTLPTPLVFAFHPHESDAIKFAVTDSKLQDKADEAGFILVMPNGRQPWGPSFNGGSCCGLAALSHSKDVELVRSIFAAVQSHLNVDLDRVYATGFSHGAYMAYRLACDASDLFAAVAPIGGALGLETISPSIPGTASDLTSCEPPYPVSVFAAHGTEDEAVPYAYFTPSLEHLTQAQSCESDLSSGHASQEGDTTCLAYSLCDGEVEVTGCSVDGGGACWFGSDTCGDADSDRLDVNESIWSFFQRNPRRPPR